jgi:hypothetical protein
MQNASNDNVLARLCFGQDEADRQGMGYIGDVLSFAFLLLVNLVNVERECDRSESAR